MSMCVSKDGYQQAEEIRFAAVSYASTLKQILALVAFALHAADAIANFKKLSDISSRGIAIEEAQHAHLRDVYWPAENQFLSEFVQPTPWDSQATLTARYAGRMWAPVAAAFAVKIRELRCAKARYCTTAWRRALAELMVARAAAKANVVTLASRIAFAEVEAVSDKDFERRKQAIALRRGLVAQAASLMAAAANGLASAGADSMRAASNALEAFGYARQRAPSYDPSFHAAVGQRVASMGPTVSAGSNPMLSGAGDIGNMSADEYAQFAAGGVANESGDWSSWSGNGVTNMTETQGPLYAGNANEAQGVLPGGQDQSLARGGVVDILLKSSGVARIDFGKVDLVDVSRYKATYEQDSPETLGTGTGENVFYGPAPQQE